MSQEETRIIQDAQSGDMNAFRRLVESHMKKVYYLSYDLTGNHHDAEDLSQEVFIKVFHSIKKFRSDAKFSSWIYRITMNAFIDKRRKKTHVTENLEDQTDDGRTVEVPVETDITANPEHTAESGLMQIHLKKALDELPKQQRSVFVLRHYNQMALKEIASVLDISEGSVKSSLFRAIRRLQKSLHFYRYDLGLEESK